MAATLEALRALYTIIETAKTSGIDFKAYLTDVIAHVRVGGPTASVAAGEIDVPRALLES